MRRRLCMILALGLGSAACGPPPLQQLCTPDEFGTCDCAAGATGQTRCNADGLGWGHCECPSAVPCGDGVCDAGETCSTCPSDCGDCTSTGCGSFVVPCSGGGYCAENSSCTDNDQCACDAGFQAVDCDGKPCNGNCAAPNWKCVSSGTGATCPTFSYSVAPLGPPAFDCSLPPESIYGLFMSDINTLWGSSVVDCPCNVDALQASCFNNAFVYPGSPGYLFYDQSFLDQEMALTGHPIAAAIVLAHETGHDIQLRFGLQFPSSISMELSADCFAGYFLAYLACQGKTDMSDVQTAFATMCSFGDPMGVPWFAAGAHGQCSARTSALAAGANGYSAMQNPLSLCGSI